jgi:hypothetical protein
MVAARLKPGPAHRLIDSGDRLAKFNKRFPGMLMKKT